MRIVIDMQGAQTESRFRGIGRYTMSFAQAVVRNRGEHEVILALNGLFPETIEPIRAAFDGLLPQENIRVWHAPGPVRECEPGNETRREAAELIREAFLASLRPDVIHISSLFEGYVDDAVTSIGRFDTSTPVSVTLYDLIPYLNPEPYLTPNPRYAQYYHRKIGYLKQADTLLAISEFSRQEGLSVLGVPETAVINVSTAIEPHFRRLSIDDATANRLREKFGITCLFVLYTGGADERKNLPRLIHAYAALPSSLRDSHQLVFAGKMPEGNIAQLQQVAKAAGLRSDELLFTGYVSDEELVQLYNLCQLYVFPSWHEGFGLPALEAMACGAPVIGANTSSLPEVIGLDQALFDPLDVASIAAKMQQALSDEVFRTRLIEHGLQQAKRFSWDQTAKQAMATWERLLCCKGSHRHLNRNNALSHLIEEIARCFSGVKDEVLVMISFCLAINHAEYHDSRKTIFVDISELVRHDAKTGIQRVVRSVLREWLLNPPEGWRIEPVYAAVNKPYRYARQFTARFLGFPAEGLVDELIDYAPGDVFFCLDLQGHVQPSHMNFYQHLRRNGVKVKFLVYDLLPILSPEYFPFGANEWFSNWLQAVGESDGAVCISKAVADELSEWMRSQQWSRLRSFALEWNHLGADIEQSEPTKGMPPDADKTLAILRGRPSFLIVGTLEPRKGHAQVLDAFERLWQAGVDLNLVIVGKQGWMVEKLVERLRSHPEVGKHLFWLEGISDEYLEKVYAVSACLIAASYGEGFGLPLIEAAQHKLPIIARDIPVFREVAGEHAFYFNAATPDDLAQAIQEWLSLYRRDQHPKSDNMPWLTWKESARRLAEKVLGTAPGLSDKQQAKRPEIVERV